MERTVELAVYVVLAVVAVGMLLAYLASSRTAILDAGQSCEQTRCASHNDSFCDDDKLVRCLIGAQGCLAERTEACQNGCVDIDGVASCKTILSP